VQPGARDRPVRARGGQMQLLLRQACTDLDQVEIRPPVIAECLDP
jgi:hypothetical protein